MAGYLLTRLNKTQYTWYLIQQSVLKSIPQCNILEFPDKKLPFMITDKNLSVLRIGELIIM